MKPLADQLKCAQRELALRKRVFPAWVKSNRITKEHMDHEIECMEAICSTLATIKHLREVSDDMKRKV